MRLRQSRNIHRRIWRPITDLKQYTPHALTIALTNVQQSQALSSTCLAQFLGNLKKLKCRQLLRRVGRLYPQSYPLFRWIDVLLTLLCCDSLKSGGDRGFESGSLQAAANLTSEGIAGQHNAMIAAPYHTAWKLCAKLRRAKHRGS